MKAPLILAAFLSAAPCGAATDMSKPPRVAAMAPYAPPPRQAFKLSNGVEVALVEDRRFPLVTVRLAVRGGAALARAEDAGLVDALAELLTEGSARRSARELAEAADAFGGSVSAEAEPDFVVLRAFSLAERAGDMLSLLLEVATEPAFPPEEVELRKRNMLEELQLNRAEPAFLAAVAFHRRLYGSHPYGTVAPTEVSIARIDRERLAALHKKLFAPANALLVVVGDIGPEDLKRLLEERLGGWKPLGELPMLPVPPPDQAPGVRGIVLVDRPGSAQAAFHLGHLALTERHPDYFPFLVANQVLGGSFAARLMSDLRERKGYTYGVYSRLAPLRSAGAFVIRTQVRNEVAGSALEAVLGHLYGMRQAPAKEEELRQAKNTLLGRFARGLERQEGLAEAVLRLPLLGLGGDFLDRYVERVSGVTAAQAHRAAREHLRPDRAVIAVAGDAAVLAKPLAPLAPAGIARVGLDGEELRP